MISEMYYPDWSNPAVKHSATTQCGYCGTWHTGMCSRVNRIEYYRDGTVKSVEVFSDQPGKDGLKGGVG